MESSQASTTVWGSLADECLFPRLSVACLWQGVLHALCWGIGQLAIQVGGRVVKGARNSCILNVKCACAGSVEDRKTGSESIHGVTQAETYRRMKRATRGDWAGFHPITNCMWVHYLADTLLKHKKLPATRAQKDALQDFR